mgnify:CR=1 FL=1
MARKTFECGNCGEPVKTGAIACPHCGACEDTGLHGESDAFPFDTGDDFDYERFVENEFGDEGDTGSPASRKELWLGVIALTLIVVFVGIAFRIL